MPIARILATLALVAACALPLPAFACEFVPYEGEESTLFSLDQGTIIEYNHEAVDGVGTQKGTGHTSCCLAFCEAYGDSMFYNTTIPHTNYAYYGDCLANPCASNAGWGWTVYDATYAYYELAENRPCIIHVTDKRWASEHWVLAIGYRNVVDPVDVTLDNLIVLDPWDGAIVPATDRYERFSDRVIMRSTRGLSIPSLTPKPEQPTVCQHAYDQGICVNCGVLWGDLNSNGQVNVVDAQIAYDVARGVYGTREAAPELFALADVSGPNGTPDGLVDAQDSLAIHFAALMG